MSSSELSGFSGPLGWINRDGKLIILGRGLRTFAQGTISVLVAIYLDLLGFSVVQIGAFITIGLVGAAIYAFLVGMFSGALGQRRLLVGLSLATVAAGISLALFDSFTVLAAIVLLTSFNAGGGGAGGPVQPLEMASLPEAASPSRRTDLFAIYNIVATGGMALGALAAGLPQILQDTLGVTALSSFKAIFLGYAVFNALAAICYSLLSPKVEVANAGQKWMNPLRLPSRRIIFTLSGLFAVDFFAGGLIVQSLVAYWFFVKFEVTLGSIGFIFFGSNIFSAISLWLAAKLANRIGLINTMVFTHIPASVLLIAMPFAPTAASAVALWLVRAFFNQMDVPTRQSYTMAVVGPEERVAMASINTVTRSAVVSTSPSIATMLWSVASASVPFVFAGFLKISYDLALWMTFRNIKTPEEKAKAEATETRSGLVGK